MDPKGKSEEEKKEIEAAAEGSEPETNGAMKEGETLPQITLKDNQDQDVDVSSLITADQGVIFFTYPKRLHCFSTSQACNFRDSYAEFGKHGYKVYGLSTDSPADQESWNKEKKFGYPLLSDPQSELIKKLGAFASPKNTVRAHFIFEKGTGKLLQGKLKVKPAEDAKHCLKFIEKHHSA
ncbi:hypothetical protein FFLO_00227 [Filobasidium floriforme]|uniref:thioredoxin-dependent peroxiredoxin n=1 Tax=Filobasidium floriforme TaxID=5210 RepID=A0A8K0JSJ7_9TREE|nr:hypothetical protein FFLO_00227 [Filobasidium floriforme]